MLAGAALLLWRDRKLALLLVGSFLIHTMVTLTYDAPQTVEYAMPAYVSLALLVAVPIGQISALSPRTLGVQGMDGRWKTAASLVRYLLVAILLMAGLANLAAHLPSYRALSRSHDTRDYAETVLREAPDRAVVLSNWHWFNPLRYLQQVEDVRPDVTVEYVAPRAEPLAETWVRCIDEHIAQRPVIVGRVFEQAYDDLPYQLEPLGEAFLIRPRPRSEVPPDTVALDITLGKQIKLLGYQLASDESEPSRPLRMTLYWSPIAPSRTEISLFAQLIGPDGRLWSASTDALHPPQQLSEGEVVVDRFFIYPLLHAAPGDYDLVIGAYSSGGRFTSPDGSDTIPLEIVHLRPSTTRPVTHHPRIARLAGGPTLIGVDYDIGVYGQVRVYLHWMGPGQPTTVHLTSDDDAMLTSSHVPALKRGEFATVGVDRPGVPSRLTALGQGGPRRWNLLSSEGIRLPSPQPGERYLPFGDAIVLTGFDGPSCGLEDGAEVWLYLRFHAQRPLERDYIVSAALTGLHPDGMWAWRETHDTVPALGAIPTLKWIRASGVLDPHQLTVPDDAPAVPVVGSLLVYDHFTQRSLPHLDERLEPSIQLGMWNNMAR
jgi:hypothetical protein